jgi:hypothetical protein
LLLQQLDDDLKDIAGPNQIETRPSDEELKTIAEYQGFFGQIVEELDARMRGVLNISTKMRVVCQQPFSKYGSYLKRNEHPMRITSTIRQELQDDEDTGPKCFGSPVGLLSLTPIRIWSAVFVPLDSKPLCFG